ncbi:phospho-sugar mutase [Streptosporangium roseum]|uniref:Glucose-1,6-bisphosphate synthase n=1 Tax=Streptosporangium roseum (strain ATCC 12428 / DSM 43021 / JCM 3005 / KCTC 9067 / NCIMB 10171 / NRRL 2505 / NI 9100) TaxID=479432 RepID=D2BD39_STRRD|nr:phospho-sugar mutase [Streptosporangium roseum]ACZ84280.1 Glucose-1,6-bisphosphate synthase [Streptosporangium roseum DSM 43021]
MSSDLVRLARSWLAQDPDPETRAELTALLDGGDADALRERFGAKLEFGTAGLRGELGAGPNRMNRVTVMRAAAGLARVLGPGRHVVIGYDARHKSDVFAHDTAAVLTGAGLRASVLPRPLPTPVLAFAVRHLGADAGVTVTASHNPPRDNGYKVYWNDGSQIVPPVDSEISAAIDAVGQVSGLPLGSPDDPAWATLGDDVVAAYLEAVTALPLGGARGLRVAYTPLHGVGGATLAGAFRAAGFEVPATVEAQAAPDPDFPTVAFPNPEEPGAMDLALELARSVGADIVLANDPDADRCAVGVPLPEGGYRMLTGDEVGALLGEHVIRQTSGDGRLVATTIVSSSLLGKIASGHGVRYAETLTGFKWIMKAGDGLVFGYEEALGYSVGADSGLPVHDKDGIGAALTVAGLAAQAKLDGRNLLDLLDDQARRYGLHATSQLSVRVDDLSLITGAMARLRATPPVKLGGREVESADDLSEGSAGLPPTDGLRYRLSGGARVVVRPSGTEPKLKCYLEVVVPVTGEVSDARAQAVQDLDALKADLSAALGL